MAETFGQRLQQRVQEFGPLCVGIDPSKTLLESWGRDDAIEGLEFFALSVLEAALGNAAVIKPQVAYFERFGAAGYVILERLLSEARDAGMMVIADAKRGDIGATNEGYAEAWLDDKSPLSCDAVTVSPYTGVAALTPFFDRVPAGKGVFLLAATSNPEGRTLQEARTLRTRPSRTWCCEAWLSTTATVKAWAALAWCWVPPDTSRVSTYPVCTDRIWCPVWARRGPPPTRSDGSSPAAPRAAWSSMCREQFCRSAPIAGR